MLISPCYLKCNNLKIKNELDYEKKSKFFTVTISVPSVKVKKVHNDMSNHVFYCALDIVHFKLNTIQLCVTCIQNSITNMIITMMTTTAARMSMG